ncbi:MAG TPA: phospholipase [Candidatus Mediterraneibacter cottocaccae]|nr:phospholipase [Candidatus Mediterraneibacter cottocaccae]
MKNKQKKKIRILMICVGAAAVIFVLFLIIQGVRHLASPQVDTAEGLAYIRAAEETDISSVEAKITQLESQSGEADGNRNIKEMFSTSVVMGDSIAAGLEAYNVLGQASVIADNSVILSDTDGEVERVEALKPQMIFLTYGLNDVTRSGEDAETFASEYETLIGKVREAVPNAHIFVNSIFPVQEQALAEQPQYENIAAFNAALEELCGRLQVGYIDNTSIVQAEHYEDDGIHFRAEFYPVWAQRMAEVAAL